jgi:hypothetical protein
LEPLAEADSEPFRQFRFSDEARFPLFKAERGTDGKILLREGLQVWTPQDLHLGCKYGLRGCPGCQSRGGSVGRARDPLGKDGRLDIRPHFFIDYQAFHSRFAHSLFFGIVLYRLAGETDVKYYEIGVIVGDRGARVRARAAFRAQAEL